MVAVVPSNSNFIAEVTHGIPNKSATRCPTCDVLLSTAEFPAKIKSAFLSFKYSAITFAVVY